MHDIIIVGGGPAGLTAAIYALRAGKSVLVIEKAGFGGQIAFSPKVENIPGTISISGSAFADQLTEQAMALGADVELENVIRVESENGIHRVFTEEGSTFEAKALILAVGVKHRMLGLPGEEELVGSGLSFCAVCDGAFYAGQDVAMIGGGNSAMQEALLLSEVCRKVTIVQNLAFFTGEQKLAEALMNRENVEVLFSTVVTAYEATDGVLTGLKLRNEDTGEEHTISVDGAFLAVGLVPENGAFAHLAALDSRGYFAAGEDCRTATPGVYVAGDCRCKTVRQVTTAAADGAIAATTACRYLDQLN
jgi:thioredoxin reductase (NADPH)